MCVMILEDCRVRTYLESIFPREALVAVSARERLYSEMNALVTLQVVIPVEALRALITAERSVGLRVGLLHVVVTVQLLHGGVSTVVVHWHAVRHAVDKRELAVRVTNVGEYGSERGVGE